MILSLTQLVQKFVGETSSTSDLSLILDSILRTLCSLEPLSLRNEHLSLSLPVEQFLASFLSANTSFLSPSLVLKSISGLLMLSIGKG